MKAWQQRLEATLASREAPAALNRGLLARLARTARDGDTVPASTLTHWLKRVGGRLEPVVQGLYLNRYRAEPVSLADAAHLLVIDAVVSLNSVLGDAGVLNNPSHIVTAVVPLDRGAPPPRLGRRTTRAGTLQFFGIPRRILEAGEADDRLDAHTPRDHARATPEKALLDWLYLAQSPRSNREAPPRDDIDVALLDRRRLDRLATAMGLTAALLAWSGGPVAKDKRQP